MTASEEKAKEYAARMGTTEAEYDFLAGWDAHEAWHKDNPDYPFDSELQWLDYNNKMLEVICDKIINHNGSGKFGSQKLQEIAEVYGAYKALFPDTSI